MTRRYQPTEDEAQQTVVEWVRIQSHRHPELEAFFHVPNEGKRSKAAGARLKSLGMEPGVPDLFLDYPSGVYHGLRIEMKVGDNTATEAQGQWLRRMWKNGYFVAVCYSAVYAEILIEQYLNLPEGGTMAAEQRINERLGVPVFK